MSNIHAWEMFQTGQGADCVIEVMPQIDGQEKQEFNVHKYMLMFNSDVFIEMFSHETTKEAREGRIKITDSTGKAVRQMLIYMYTGALPMEYTIETDAVPVMHIANKYQIKPLMQSIEQGLVFSLSLTNVLDRLEMADLYQLKSLYSSCGQMIQANLKAVKKESNWLELKRKAPELAFAILEDVDEFGIGNIFKTTSNNKISNNRALEMFENGQGADCVIEVVPQIDDQEKQEFNVHKFVLMVNSDVFQAMFGHENTQEAREGRVQITDSTPTAVRQMLIYMYTGALPNEYTVETDAGPLMHIAMKYQIKPLVQLIEQRLVNSLSLANVLDRLEMADVFQLKSLYSSCGQLIQANFNMVKKEANWLELKRKAPDLAFAILEEDVNEYRNEKLQFPDKGTNVIKFAAPTGNDTMWLKLPGIHQSVTAKLMCISGMKEYERQSLEELRLADYLAGRKVNTSSSAPTAETTLFGQQQRAGLFGQGLERPSGGIFTGTTSSVPAFPVATTATISLFGTQAVSAEPSIFGQTVSQQQTNGIFGQQQRASLFGQGLARPSGSGGIFTRATTSVPAFPDATTATTSLFDTQAVSAEPSTSGSIFFQTASQSQRKTTGIFGQQQSTVMAPISNIGDAGPSTSTSMAKQQYERPRFGQHQNPLNWASGTGSTHIFGNDLKEQKLMNANLESKNQALHANGENLELKAENQAGKENAEQNANYQALEAKVNEFSNMLTEQRKQMMAQFEAKLSTQNEKHQKQVEQLESKIRMLEEKLRNVEFAEKENGALDGKIEQLKDECSNSNKLPGFDVE